MAASPFSGLRARRPRFAAAAGFISLLAVAAATGWLTSPPAPAAIVLENKDASTALTATVNNLLANSGRPTDPAAVQEAAANLFVILNPALAEKEVRRDPAFLQSEASATASFFNPGALHAKKMEEAGYRQQYEAAMQALQGQAAQTAPAIQPAATDPKQIEALRNDPDWRRQREAPLRALMPPGR